MTNDHLIGPLVRRFLLEEVGVDRNLSVNAVYTRNLRLTAIHSLFRFVSRQILELIEHSTQIRNIPLRRTTPANGSLP